MLHGEQAEAANVRQRRRDEHRDRRGANASRVPTSRAACVTRSANAPSACSPRAAAGTDAAGQSPRGMLGVEASRCVTRRPVERRREARRAARMRRPRPARSNACTMLATVVADADRCGATVARSTASRSAEWESTDDHDGRRAASSTSAPRDPRQRSRRSPGSSHSAATATRERERRRRHERIDAQCSGVARSEARQLTAGATTREAAPQDVVRCPPLDLELRARA